MKHVGIDLHKKTIVVCVMSQERKVLSRATLGCPEPEKIVADFRALGKFQAAIEPSR